MWSIVAASWRPKRVRSRYVDLAIAVVVVTAATRPPGDVRTTVIEVGQAPALPAGDRHQRVESAASLLCDAPRFRQSTWMVPSALSSHSRH